jgi:hypothetical protein
VTDEPVVVARVLLRSARGERPGIDVPITAGEVERLKPSPDAVAAVAAHFRQAGFTVLGPAALGVGISGSKTLFEQHFGVELGLGADGAYTVRKRREPVARSDERGRIADPGSLPADRLPTTVRKAISQIALEAAATFDEPTSNP